MKEREGPKALFQTEWLAHVHYTTILLCKTDGPQMLAFINCNLYITKNRVTEGKGMCAVLMSRRFFHILSEDGKGRLCQGAVEGMALSRPFLAPLFDNALSWGYDSWVRKRLSRNQ